MRCSFVLLALVAFGAAASVGPYKQRAADQDFLKKQQDVIYLLQKITQDIPNEQLQTLGNTYDIANNYYNYENPIIVKYYVGAVNAGLIQPKGTVYSNSISQLRKEVALLYRIFLGAKDYQTFLGTAAWARVHVNEGQFVKAFVGAILVRPDTQGVILPSAYEIFPQYHFDSRIIKEAQVAGIQAIQQQQGQNIIIPANYSANLPYDEEQLAYFTQDVGLAAYYGYVSLTGYILGHHGQSHQQGPIQYQQQMAGQYQAQGVGQDQLSSIGHGAQYYYLHQQLLAYYQLNRLSNGLGPIADVDYENVEAQYQPHLRHLNGLEFPGRPQHLQLQYQHQQKLFKYVYALEQRLHEAIDAGHVITPQGVFLSLYQPQGLNILGDLIEGTGRSVNPRYYGSYQAAASKLLGNAPEVQNIWDYTPSVLELGQTAVHDPAFYQLYKKVLHFFYKYQESLPAYQYNDLVLPGVTIQNVDISQLVTLFNDYYVDLDSVTPQSGKQFQQQTGQSIKAHLKRLDHKAYDYQITVQADQPISDAVVRVYLGPKHDYQGKPISISEYRDYFVQLDQWIQNLQQGQNVIVRHSQQASGQSYDYPSVQDIQQSVNGAIRSQDPFYITEPQQIFGFPARLSLPKGQSQGFPLQLLVVISGQGLQNVPYGPVIPEDQQTYQSQHYQIIGVDQYQPGTPVQGMQQAAEVVPEDFATGEQQIQAVRTHYANIYTKYHGQYPYTQILNPVGQGVGGMIYNVHGQQYGIGHGVQGQQGVQGHFGVSGQYGVHGQQYGQHGVQGQQYVAGQFGQQYGQQGQQYGQQGQQYGQQQQQQQVPQGQIVKQEQHVQGQVPVQQQGFQQYQHPIYHGQVGTYQQVQKQPIGVQGVKFGVQGGVQAGILGQAGVQAEVQAVPVQAGVQGLLQEQYVNQIASGQIHAGGYQGVYAQAQTVQDQSVNQYYQNKQIHEVIGGAISLDGKPLGYPLDRPLSPGALYVPNIYVKDVLVYHEGQSTNYVY